MSWHTLWLSGAALALGVRSTQVVFYLMALLFLSLFFRFVVHENILPQIMSASSSFVIVVVVVVANDARYALACVASQQSEGRSSSVLYNGFS
jgi:hypothetical protein